MPEAGAAPKLAEVPPQPETIGAEQAPPKMVPRRFAVAMGIYIVVLNLVLVYLLAKIWPGVVPLATREWVALVGNGRLSVGLWIETRYLLIVVLSGALGSYVHLATSFADFVGNRKLVASWGWWYLLRPFIGMTLAVLVYFVVRAGLVSGTSGAGNLSPYGVAAIAGMCGLFSKQATDKLRELFENLFRTQKAPERADPLPLKDQAAGSGATQ